MYEGDEDEKSSPPVDHNNDLLDEDFLSAESSPMTSKMNGDMAEDSQNQSNKSQEVDFFADYNMDDD